MEIGIGKRLKKSFSYIEKYTKTDNGSTEYTTVSENFHIISKMYSLCDKNFLCDVSLYHRLARYLNRAGWRFGKDGFFEFFVGTGFSFGEIYHLRSVFTAALLISAADEIRAKEDNRRMNGRKLISSVLSLHKINELEESECFEKLCPLEKMLENVTPDFASNDEESKNQCRTSLIKYAEKNALSESAALTSLIGSGKTVYDLLKGKKSKKALFFIVYSVLFALLSFASFFYFGIIALFALVPIYITSGIICDRIFSRIVKVNSPLRLDLSEVPDDAKVLCVTASLLFGREKDSALFDRLETFYLKNMKKNVYFGLLADFPDSEKKVRHTDKAAAFYAEERIKELNTKYGDVFVLLLRNRTLNKADGTYGGRERKRGAVCDLVNFITDGENPFSVTVNEKSLEGIRYVMTLDSDTLLPINGILDLLGVALHPANKPKVKNGKIVSGHAIFQPKMKTGLDPSYSTYYALLESEDGGFYERASYDRYQSLFGTGMFCGKGLFDVNAFKKYVIPAFPENKILSHDIPEGCILRCMYVPNVVFTDSGPKNAVSSFNRLHRWIRGDLQNSFFLRSEHIDGTGKFKMIESILRHLAPLFSVIGIFVSAFSGIFAEDRAIAFFLTLESYLILPSILSFASHVFYKAYTPRRYFSVAFTSAYKNTVRLVMLLSSVTENAYRSADAVVRTIWRTTVSKKRLLEWVTFSQSDSKGSGFAYHISELIASSFAGVLLFAFSKNLVFRLFGAFTFLFPLLSFALSSVIPQKTVKISKDNKKMLTEWNRKMFAYFDERVSEKNNYLPPDNVQLSPADKAAERTSPTNIGLYMLCVIAAADFGFITKEDALCRIEKTADTIDKLKKYRGHLYNWYDTRSLDVLGVPYVSTVDSGNFVTMMITLAECLGEFGSEKADETAKRVRRFALDADFGFLYDKRKKLLSLGYSEENGLDTICYDMLMSEIRTTCFYLCSYGVFPKAMWNTLSRDVTEKNGYIGMVSWAGTAFEYFMPELFLGTKPNSFIDESLEFAFYNQRTHRKNGLWGISESAYYTFDTDMNYQYKAHGVPSLALKKYPEKEFVVSPYSVFLMLRRDTELCVKELEEMSERGMYGEYGFYEANDLSDGNEIVRSYMSHHIGMSVIASANACFDNIFVRRFMRDKRISASRELLDEKIPSNVTLIKKAKLSRIKEPYRTRYEKSGAVSRFSGIIRNGNASLIYTADGKISMRYGSYMINDCELSSASDEYGLIFGAICEKGVSLFPTENAPFSAVREKNGIALISNDPVCPSAAKFGISSDGKGFVITVKTDSSKAASVCLSFRPVLERKEKYSSHQAYSKLFIVSKYIPEKGIIIFKRKTRPSSRYPLIAVALADATERFVFRTDEEHLAAHSRNKDAHFFDIPYDGRTGICINPACYVKVSPDRKNEVIFLVVPSYSEEECISSVEKLRESAKCSPASHPNGLADICVSRCIEIRNAAKLTALDTSVLWKAGISGDVPLLTLSVYNENVAALSSFISAYKTLTTSFLRCELLLLINEAPSYSSPLADFAKDFIAEMGCERYLDKRNGIFIKNSAFFNEDEKEFIKTFSSFYHETDSLCPREEAESKVYLPFIKTEEKEKSERIIADSVIVSGSHPLPRSFVLAGFGVGTLITSKTLGFTFFKNSHDKRISYFKSDPYSVTYGEMLFAVTENGVFDLIAGSDRAEFRIGKAVYYGKAAENDYTVTVCVSPVFPVKLVNVDFYGKTMKIAYRIRPAVKCCIGISEDKKKAFFKGMKHSESSYTSFVSCVGSCVCTDSDEYLLKEGKDDSMSFVSCLAETSAALYVLGAAPDRKAGERIIANFDRHRFETECENAVKLADSFIPPYSLYTDNGETDALYSVFSPYQTAFSRYLAKTGFYQSSGAYGFRDQLQDCLCLVYSRPDIVKLHLFRAASHQYREGDVMHWWFPDNGKSHGIRSKCSDDLLFLPYVCADYVKKTGDVSVLTKQLPYLYSPPLDENERYETPEYYGKCESLYMHCLRAIFRAYSRLGDNCLCLMGSCDWNDGINAAGEKGKGESVFTTLFLSLVSGSFMPLCELMKDTKTQEYLGEICTRTVKAVNDIWENDRYPRGTFDDGSFFGVESSEECKIDLLSQSFAAIVMGKTERTVKAMNTAYERLFDKEKGIFRLFDPPFDKTDAGYISAYPHGLRENGGQYTHGALWGVWGLVCVGEYEKALSAIESIIPVFHTSDDEKTALYKLESYVIPADIYTSGRGGWSWYTGSAGWYFKIMTEVINGLVFTNGFNTLDARPLKEYTLITERNGYKLKIISSRKEKSATLDGSPCVFPLDIPKGEHILRLPPIY